MVERLTSGRDIRAVLGARSSAGGTAAVVAVRLRSEDASDRVAIVAGRAVGGAVVRNRAKRRLRAALAATEAGSGRDIVVLARKGAVTMTFESLREELALLVARATKKASRTAAVAW